MDASAVLAWAFGEPAADSVEAQLGDAVVTSPNWAEVLQKVNDTGRDAKTIAVAMLGFGINVVQVDIDDATATADLWERGRPLSLADRFCIAVGRRLDVPIWTCDRAWSGVDERVVVIR